MRPAVVLASKVVSLKDLVSAAPGAKVAAPSTMHGMRSQRRKEKDINYVDQKYCSCRLLWHAFRLSLHLSVVSVDLNLDMRNAEIIALSSKCFF